jgi:RecB family endonuclease NucS
MKLWQVAGTDLKSVEPTILKKESRLEDWVEKDPSLLGMDVMIIARQLVTPCGRIDLLAIDGEANLVVLELKRDKTPRDVVPNPRLRIVD